MTQDPAVSGPLDPEPGQDEDGLDDEAVEANPYDGAGDVTQDAADDVLESDEDGDA